MKPEEFFVVHLSDIHRIARLVCRRRHVTAADTEEFIQTILISLIENDYALIRQYNNRTDFTTYLTLVIVRSFDRFRRERRLEPELLAFDVVAAPLTTDFDATAASAIKAERTTIARVVTETLTSFLRTLDEVDQLLLRLRYHEGVRMPDVARRLKLDQKKAYKRLDFLLSRMREALRLAGVDAAQIDNLIEAGMGAELLSLVTDTDEEHSEP